MQAHHPELGLMKLADALRVSVSGYIARKGDGMLGSDQGCQYASCVFRGKLNEYGVLRSMSREVNCRDNTLKEGRFKSCKNERIHHVLFAKWTEMKDEAFEYIEVFHNWKCHHSTLGYKSITQFLLDRVSIQQQEIKSA